MPQCCVSTSVGEIIGECFAKDPVFGLHLKRRLLVHKAGIKGLEHSCVYIHSPKLWCLGGLDTEYSVMGVYRSSSRG